MLKWRFPAALAFAAVPSFLPLSAPALTGVCPDGSVFIAPEGAAAPCANAKEVEPHEVPPLRPQHLPHPYTWQVYNELQSQSNPYNLIDSARDIRALHEEGQADARTQAALQPDPYGASTPGVSAAPPSIGPIDLGLGDDELRDLYQLVELSQELTPAAFQRATADGRGVFRVSLARSTSVEDRIASAWEARGGIGESDVVVFTAVSMQAEPFYANLTFVQDHLTFQPAADDPRQLGVLQGHLGDLEADEVVLGYVILPEAMDSGEAMDVYWNDRRISVAFPR
jgi:hypothetical protein